MRRGFAIELVRWRAGESDVGISGPAGCEQRSCDGRGATAVQQYVEAGGHGFTDRVSR